MANRTSLYARIRLDASTWSYPGWAGIVWDEGPYSEAVLAKNGLAAYAQYPLLRCVGIDRSFYRPLTEGQYARYAGQVPDDFRFVVKAPALVTDALVRGEQGQGRQPNTAFLDPVLATQEFITPTLAFRFYRFDGDLVVFYRNMALSDEVPPLPTPSAE